MMINELMQIAELIFKSSLDSLTKDEQSRLSTWINKSDENRELYKKLSNTKDLQNRYRLHSQINQEDAWKKLFEKEKDIIRLNTVNNRKQTKRKMLHWLYASSAIFILAFCTLFFLYQSKNSSEKQTEIAANLTPSEITHGTSKAILYTATGSAVSLEDNDTIISETGIKLVNEKKTLSYIEEDKNMTAKNEKARLNRLVTPKGGEYKIILSDGTQVWINADSEFKYPSKFPEGEERIVYLEGEAYFDVKKDESAPFIVKTVDTEVMVLGTSFNLMAYKNSKLNQTTLVEGKVQVSINNGDKKAESFSLLPNMQMELNRENNSMNTRRVDVNKFIAWRNGLFSFDNQRLEDILIMLSRWYDFEISFDNEAIKDIRFTGEMKRFASFQTLLDLLKINSGIRFEIENRTLHCYQ